MASALRSETVLQWAALLSLFAIVCIATDGSLAKDADEKRFSSLQSGRGGGRRESKDNNIELIPLQQGPVPDCDDIHSTRYDPLACWLWKLKIDVPDQSFKKIGFKMVRAV
jgi:hypothetical protein